MTDLTNLKSTLNTLRIIVSRHSLLTNEEQKRAEEERLREFVSVEMIAALLVEIAKKNQEISELKRNAQIILKTEMERTQLLQEIQEENTKLLSEIENLKCNSTV